MNLTKVILFAGGLVSGTAGVALLSSEDAKKAYTHCTAAVLRGKDCIMNTVATVKENCEDIYADAEDINVARADEKAKRKLEEAKAIIAQYENEVGAE